MPLYEDYFVSTLLPREYSHYHVDGRFAVYFEDVRAGRDIDDTAAHRRTVGIALGYNGGGGKLVKLRFELSDVGA